MNKSGFTLIELLAVIVITGLVMAITIPNVLEMLETSKRETFRLDVAGIVRNFDNQIYNLDLKGQSYDGTFIINDGIINEVNNYDYSIDKKYDGVISINDNKEIAVALHDSRYCVVKNNEESSYVVTDYVEGNCTINTPESCFEFNSSTKTLTNYKFDDGYYDEPSTATTLCGLNPVIPDQINGVDVEVIGESAFLDYDITGVVLPKNLKIIEGFAFASNYIGEIIIPDGVERIDYNAFYTNQITELIIPDSVLYLGYDAFKSNLISTLVLPELIMMETGVFTRNELPDSQAFIYKRNLDGTIDNTVLISYGGAKKIDVVIPNNVVEIAESAFYQSRLESVTIPNTVTKIGGWAFAANALTSINIPTNLETIERYTFMGNSIVNLVIPSNVKYIYEYAFGSNYLTKVTFSPGSQMAANYIFQYAFRKTASSNYGLTSIIYPSSNVQNWNNAINGTSATPFTTGTVTNASGNVIITSN